MTTTTAPLRTTAEQPLSARTRLFELSNLAAPGRVGRRGWIIVGSIVLLLLLPTLFLPLGPDQGIFFTSGRMILEGAVHYRDIVEIKPPLIYYLYAGAIGLFGDNAISIRLLDLLLQCGSCWLMIALVRRVSGNDLAAAIAAIGYLISYLAQGFASLAQTESYVALLGCAIAWQLLLRRTGMGFLLAGIFAGILFHFKFTLGAVMIALILAEITLYREEGWKSTARHCAWIITGFALMVLLLVLYLVATDSYEGFQDVNQFTSGYVRNEWKSLSHWLKNFVTLIPSHFAIDYSVILSIATVIGVAISAGLWQEQTGLPQPSMRLLRLSTIITAFLIGTVAIEARYLPWHITRLYPFAAILAGFGLPYLLHQTLRVQFPPLQRLYKWFLIALIVPSFILFTPLTGYGWRTAALAIKNLKRQTGADVSRSELVQDDGLEDARTVGAYIIGHRRPGDRVMAVATLAGMIYYYCDHIPDYKILHSAFLIAPFAPERWKDYTRSYLLNERPRFIVAQINDSLPSLTGSSDNAIKALRKLPGIDSLLGIDYTLEKRTVNLELYQLKETGGQH